ncbi:Tom22 mitochondrial import receptor subunit [Candida orthopsilosis Co 90-125]|uniref:Tom22 mitochondrial import receptor subunit n=1 Tax=Candida orthopsilosis (strain 90-125) TaxID=1136231 RepID=H8XA29_CANO9|nr:Tom22 mitochondrial import receptor subunit [Candida orthopsilosis Co 90-125]CCG25006.1 Tom22 mitochondrial import receptor subunit [Candida orthopsilosis Co 90-125]
MVKLTQVEDEFQTNYADGTTTVEKVEVDTFADSDSEYDDDEEEDDFDVENETIYDRVVALKDIISPQHRDQLCNLSSTVSSYVSSGLNNGGKLLWTLTSSSLLLGVPLALAILSETQLQEMESNISLQQSAQDVLAPGSEEAFGKKEHA